MSTPILRLNFKGVASLAVAALLGWPMAGRVLGLGADALQSMVIVEGDQGRGSGFIVKMDGKTYVITNSHVVRGNKNLKFKNLSNQELAVGPLEIADHADLVRAEVAQASSSLTVAEKEEQTLQIGSLIVVAGNSEGEGVVREIPGKVVGIGPDRVEVDAKFVPGNSGSPILLKSTGQVIGVATYMKIPRSIRTKSVTSLNEVRRFGYRLDTVGKWVAPQPTGRLVKEGLKLAELEQTMSVIVSVLNSGTAAIARSGSVAYVNKERLAANPQLASLAAALEQFAADSQSSKDPAEGKKHVLKLFDALKTSAVDDIRGFKEEHFSGYYATQFKEQLAQRKDLYEWLDQTIAEAGKNPQFLAGPVAGSGTPPSGATPKGAASSAATYGTTPAVGHLGGGSEYRDVGKSGTILVGFDLVISPFKDSNETVRGIAPIYLPKAGGGETKGGTFGAQQGSDTRRLIAKQGYAVGAVTVQFAHLAIRRIKVRFDRIKGDELDTKDSYESPWVGQFDDAKEGMTDLKGRMPVGISGRAGKGLDCVGLLYAVP